MAEKKYIWRDRKHTFLGLPWSFTVYMLTDEKLIIRTGFLNRDEEEIRLYRIMDIKLKRSLGERILGIGTIHCYSADKSTPEFDIKRIRHSEEIKEMLSNMIEHERMAKRVSSREFMDFDDGSMDDDNNID